MRALERKTDRQQARFCQSRVLWTSEPFCCHDAQHEGRPEATLLLESFLEVLSRCSQPGFLTRQLVWCAQKHGAGGSTARQYLSELPLAASSSACHFDKESSEVDDILRIGCTARRLPTPWVQSGRQFKARKKGIVSRLLCAGSHMHADSCGNHRNQYSSERRLFAFLGKRLIKFPL
jgi:hypothetical protein